MTIDKFGRFIADGNESPSTTANVNSSLSFKNYIDNCLKKISTDIEVQLNSIVIYQNQLLDIHKNQIDVKIKTIESSLKQIDEYKNKTNLSIYHLEKSSTLCDIYMKQNVKTIATLEKKVFDMDVRMKLKKH